MTTREELEYYQKAAQYFAMGLASGAEEFRWDFGNVPLLAGLLSQQMTTAFLHLHCGKDNDAIDTPEAFECSATFLALFNEMQRIKKQMEASRTLVEIDIP